MRVCSCAFSLFALAVFSAMDARGDQPEPLSPEASLASIHVLPGLRVELVAAEPEVFDPVALAFDAGGRLFVVEDRGYPSGPGAGAPPAGDVALLEDKNRDGRYESRTVFADGLDFPTGVMCWRGGILVTDSPRVYFFQDTDGDRRADVREVVLEGFALGGSTQLHVSHPTLGLDNWIYFTNGLSGGTVSVTGHPESGTVEMGNKDLRYHPLTHVIQAVSGQAQFGLTFDDLGNKFVCSNRKHIEQVMLQSEDLARNPHLDFSETVASIPDHGGASKIYALSEARTTAYAHAGTFTAACGVCVYRGTALPAEYYGNSFTCDPTGNLVHRDVLEAHGAALIARRKEDQKEFFASTDNWTRPVFLANAPDGALYVCDMYRRTIEHPTYLPPEVASVTDFDAGKDRGRIYRVAAETSPAADALPLDDFESASEETLIGALCAQNAWQRTTAQRLLLERAAPASLPALRQTLAGDAPVNAKLHALHLLEAFGALEEEALLHAMNGEDAPLREHAVRIARTRVGASDAVAAAVLRRAADAEARVRFAAALALGDAPGIDAAPALAHVMHHDIDDVWMRAAVLSSVSGKWLPFARQLLQEAPRDAAGAAPLFSSVGRMLALGAGRDDCMLVLGTALAGADPAPLAAWQEALLAGMLEGVRQGGPWEGTGTAFDRLAGAAPAEMQEKLRAYVDSLLQRAAEESIPLPGRLQAIAILGNLDYDRAGDALSPLLSPRHVPELQLAAVQALGRMDDPRVAEAMVSKDAWGGFTTGLRSAAAGMLLSRGERIERLLTALEQGDVPAWSIDPGSRARLEKSSDAAVQQRAQAVFATVKRSDRSAIYSEYKSVLALRPDAAAGHAIFTNTCSTCHLYNGEGHLVGPDLTGIRSQPLESILLHVIDPNSLLEPGYENYVVETADLESFSGLITAQTATSITLRQVMGVEQTIPRDNIERISATSMSMMPEELEKSMSRQDIRNLLGFLKGK